MCGIVGYIGKKEASPILLDGLKRLEYRGYDSAGIAIWDGRQIKAAKTKGRITDLVNLMSGNRLSGQCGIAHTRWATHGQPSTVNAHPHSDPEENVFLVHNGIIENYKELKKNLQNEGSVFRSETDTEVLAHLVSFFLKRGNNFENAVKKTLRLVRGTYAILAMAASEPEKIVAARLASPLRLGKSNGEIIIASDPAAILTHTNQIITLTDGEVAVIDRQGYSISTLSDNQAVSKEADAIEWDLSETDQGDFPHFTLKEIFEQPETIENSLRGRLDIEKGLAILGGLKTVEEKLRHIKKIHLVACGTAAYAALVGEYMLEEYAEIPVEVCIASEFRYRKPILDPETDAVLAISQSGETADTLAAVREAKEKGVLTLGIVNVIGSSIAQETKAGVYNHAGPEIGVASTKVFTSQLAVLALLTLLLGRQRRMSLVMGSRLAQALLKIPAQLNEILGQNSFIKDLAGRYKDYPDLYYLGRKYNFPVALEGALKIKELAYVNAQGTASGELKHGSLAVINESFPCLFIAPRDSVYEKNLSNMQEVKARGGKIIAVASAGDEDIKHIADEVIYIPKTLEMLTPILAVAPLQLFAYHVAAYLGRDIDKPRNIAKSVTVE